MWGKLVENWDVRWEYQPPGENKTSGDAEWHFAYILGGYGIQDVWISPARILPLDPLQERYIGTNIRVFNPQENKWLIRWTNNRFKHFAEYEAFAEGDQIVMIPVGDASHSERIYFFDIEERSFKWRQEISKDGGESWTAVQWIYGALND